MKKKENTITVFGLHERDLLHHLLLAFVLFIGALFLFLAESSQIKFIIGCLMAVFYVAWSIVHHKLDGDLYGKNVIEYVLIAFLGIIILAGILL
jgi:hypothetical protein